jgi:hypothetical protein
MPDDLPIPSLCALDRGQPVAQYGDGRGAALAAAHLIDCGFPEGEFTVRPADMEMEPAACHRLPNTRQTMVAAAVTSALVAVVATFAAMGFGPGPVFLAVVAGGLAALVGAGSARIARRALEWRVQRAAHLVHAGTFQIVVRPGRADEAEHALARWWDPEARPAGRRAA